MPTGRKACGRELTPLLDVNVSVLRPGHVVLVYVPFEVFVEFGLDLRCAFPEHVVRAQPRGGHNGYLPTLSRLRNAATSRRSARARSLLGQGEYPVPQHRHRATRCVAKQWQTDQEAVSTHIDRLGAAVARDRSRALDWSDKAVQPAWYGCSIAEVAEARPKLDQLSTPMMTLDRHALDENLAAMSRWCAQAGLSQAPPGLGPIPFS